MGLADLANVPSDPDGMASWAFEHIAQHRDQIAAIYRIYRIALPEYLIAPVNLRDPGQFAQLHQAMHNNTTAVLGISGYDLTNAAFQDPQEMAAWIQLNFQAHYEENGLLAI